MSAQLETITPFGAEPPRLLADANYNLHIVRGQRRIRPDMLIVVAHQVGLQGAPDPEVLAYGAAHNLILLTHDIQTMPDHFATFLMALKPGEYSPGIWYMPQTLAVGVAIRAILETWLCSAHDEYRNLKIRLP